MLGIGLTALMASFMSGMAGNVTAFNTVWTYDIYQSYIAPEASPTRITSGWAAWRPCSASSSASAAPTSPSKFNNIMDMLQLVFGFVNAPLFATFLLGMFWRRTTGHGAFFGLLGGTLAAAIFHGLTLSTGRGSRHQRRLARQGIHLPQRDGPELLDGHRRVDHLLCADHS